MLNEMLGFYWWRCPLCGRYHRGPLEYWWCPLCGSNLRRELKKLEKRIETLENQNLQEQEMDTTKEEDLMPEN